MKYTEDEILTYARKRIRNIDQQKGKRLILGFMGTSVIGIFIYLVQIIQEKSKKVGTDLLMDEKFILGIAMGIMIFIFLGVAAFAFVQMFTSLYGRENEVYRLLVRLKDEKSK